MWRIPVSPPIPVYTEEYTKSNYKRGRRWAQVLYNAPAVNVEFVLQANSSYPMALRRIVIENTGDGPVNIDFTVFDANNYAYAFWNDQSAVGNCCIAYTLAGALGVLPAGVPLLLLRPLPVDRLDGGERLEILMTTGAADTGAITVYYEELLD